jgi:multidrug efflux system outer membrane protein
VLSRRPDLRAAERDLAAAGYDAAAARRDFWPSLSLTAALGSRAVDPENLLAQSGALTQVAAALAAPLRSFGRLEGARDQADARRLAAAIAYRKAATEALDEVERALAAARSAAARSDALNRALGAAADQSRLASSRYRSGLAPFLEVLVAERAVFDAEANLAGARADAARAYAALNLAMGLGADL